MLSVSILNTTAANKCNLQSNFMVFCLQDVKIKVCHNVTELVLAQYERSVSITIWVTIERQPVHRGDRLGTSGLHRFIHVPEEQTHNLFVNNYSWLSEDVSVCLLSILNKSETNSHQLLLHHSFTQGGVVSLVRPLEEKRHLWHDLYSETLSTVNNMLMIGMTFSFILNNQTKHYSGEETVCLSFWAADWTIF